MADNLKVFGTTYYDVQGQKFTDLDGNEKTYIRPAGTKQIAQNGTADVKKYEFAEVAVPASAVDEGTKQITQNGNGQNVVGYAAVDVNVPGIVPAGTKQINQNGTHDVAQYASAEVNVPNTYAASDEGKVVQSGALVAQTSDTVTQNGTVDTTLINSLTVNVSGGGGGQAYDGTVELTNENAAYLVIPVDVSSADCFTVVAYIDRTGTIVDGNVVYDNEPTIPQSVVSSSPLVWYIVATKQHTAKQIKRDASNYAYNNKPDNVSYCHSFYGNNGAVIDIISDVVYGTQIRMNPLNAARHFCKTGMYARFAYKVYVM